MSRFLAITLLICIYTSTFVSGAVIRANKKRSDHVPDKVHDIFRPQVLYTQDSPNKISTISSIIATVFGYKYQIKLVLNRQLVPENFKHTYQNQQGHAERYDALSSEFCHYQGRVFYITPSNASIPLKSEVIISACNGFNGMIMINNQVFIVAPMNEANSLEGDHIIYEENEFSEIEYPNPLTGTEDEPNSQGNEEEHEENNENGHEENEEVREEHDGRNEEQRDREGEKEHDEEGEYDSEPRRSRRQANSNTKYIELVIVNDKKFVDKMNGDLKAVENHVIQIVNLVDAMYKTINVRVALVGMVTWNMKDEIAISSDSRMTLERLSTYRFNDVMKFIPNDNVQLMTGIVFNDGAGRAWQSTMCKYYSTGANYAFANIARAAAFMARNLGHNLGMRTDQKEECTCVKDPEISNGCVMSSHIYGPPSMAFSSCSLQDLRKAFQHGIGQCLSNVPQKPMPSTTKSTVNAMTTQSQTVKQTQRPATQANPTVKQTERPATQANPTIKQTQRPATQANPTIKQTERPATQANPTVGNVEGVTEGANNVHEPTEMNSGATPVKSQTSSPTDESIGSGVQEGTEILS